tara:strand:+ start:1694 stop:2026 length:333 start_codon:yes stop_codon:yes gene_type:complete
MRWSVAQTKTQSTDLRIIQGHYPWCVTTELGEHVALVKSQKKANTGFAKASGVNDRDNAYEIAELISAAPEMYAALELLIDTWDSGFPDPHLFEQDIENARKALRKAKPN